MHFAPAVPRGAYCAVVAVDVAAAIASVSVPAAVPFGRQPRATTSCKPEVPRVQGYYSCTVAGTYRTAAAEEDLRTPGIRPAAPLAF